MSFTATTFKATAKIIGLMNHITAHQKPNFSVHKGFWELKGKFSIH